MTNVKACSRCDTVKPLSEFQKNGYCKPCGSEVTREWQRRNPERTRAIKAASMARTRERVAARERRKNLRAKYGLTVEAYEVLLEVQRGVCAICRRPPGKNRLAVDHDHMTGRVRGLLCVSCNTVLGKIEAGSFDVRAAAEYLRRDGENALGST